MQGIWLIVTTGLVLKNQSGYCLGATATLVCEQGKQQRQ